MSPIQAVIKINIKVVLFTLLGITLFLIFARVTTELFALRTGHDALFGLVRLFDLDEEGNIPSYFSALILMIAALLLLFIAKQKIASHDTFRIQWMALSLMFIYMSADEAASIHELADRPLRALLGNHANGVLHFSWVIAFVPIVLFVALYFLRFLLHFPRKTQFFITVSAAMFLFGAMGMEMLQAVYVTTHIKLDFFILLVTTIEETLEMLGVILFIAILLQYIEQTYRQLSIEFHH